MADQTHGEGIVGEPDVHLARLLAPEDPWYQFIFDIYNSIKGVIKPVKLPPLELTSRPVDIREIHIYAGNEKKAGITSLAIHVVAIALLLFIGSLKPVQNLIKEELVPLVSPDLSPYKPDKQMHGGGGGGDHSVMKASEGKLPKIAPKQFTPPKVDPPEHPKLPIEATIVADAPIPNIESPNYGDPLSHLGIPSNGTGIGGGIGSGSGGGVGSGNGAGVGPGSGGGFGGGAYRIGGGVSAPTVITKVEPEYSEEARKAKWQGQVVLSLVVDEHGRAQNVKVLRALGLGLDQKAIEAVEKWVFKPGTKDGKAVPVYATIQIDFRLL